VSQVFALDCEFGGRKIETACLEKASDVL